jgi:hypothetical protein
MDCSCLLEPLQDPNEHLFGGGDPLGGFLVERAQDVDDSTKFGDIMTRYVLRSKSSRISMTLPSCPFVGCAAGCVRPYLV